MSLRSSKFLPEKYTLYELPTNSNTLHKVVLHEFLIDDVNEPFLHIADPIAQWKESEKGQWCMQHCEGEIVFHSILNNLDFFGYRILLQGNLSKANLVYFKLKWPADCSNKWSTNCHS